MEGQEPMMKEGDTNSNNTKDGGVSCCRSRS